MLIYMYKQMKSIIQYIYVGCWIKTYFKLGKCTWKHIILINIIILRNFIFMCFDIRFFYIIWVDLITFDIYTCKPSNLTWISLLYLTDSSDIVDCKLKLILGLIWTLILHYSISMPMWEGEEPTPSEGGPTPKQRLLNWVQSKVPDQPIKNFTTDWNDGRAIGALVDAVGPGNVFTDLVLKF